MKEKINLSYEQTHASIRSSINGYRGNTLQVLKQDTLNKRLYTLNELWAMRKDKRKPLICTSVFNDWHVCEYYRKVLPPKKRRQTYPDLVRAKHTLRFEAHIFKYRERIENNYWYYGCGQAVRCSLSTSRDSSQKRIYFLGHKKPKIP